MINLQYSAVQTPLPQFIYKDIQRFCKASNTYHFQPPEMIDTLAERHKVPRSNIFLSSGSNESILGFIKAFGEKIIIFTPTYKEYSRKDKYTGDIKEVWSESNGEYLIRSDYYVGASLIFLANPNNPFGYSKQSKIVELIEQNPKAIVVIDEAYSKFLNESMVGYVAKYKNLAVLRSFSKDYGMAGCRIGYVVAHPDITNAIGTYIQETNVSYLSVGAALSALGHEEYFDQLITDIKTTKSAFSDFLTSQGLRFLESNINAVLLSFATQAQGKSFHK